MKKILPILLIWPLAVLADPPPPAVATDLSNLTLSMAEQRWQTKNHEIRLARDQVDGADADRLTAAQRPNPQLSLNSTAVNTSGNGSGLGRRLLNDADLVLRIDQTFERGNKRQLRMQAADYRLAASRKEMADTYRQGRIALYQAYYDLMQLQEKLRIAQENSQLFVQTTRAAEIRLGAGDIPASDLSRIRVDALRAENDVQAARNGLRQAQAVLAYQIGAENESSAIGVSDPWPVMASPDTSAPDMEHRADIQAAQARVQAAEAARDLAQSLKTRDVTLGFQIEHNGSNTPSRSVGFGVSVPLMTGYEYQGEIGRAEADLQSARDFLEQTRAQAATELNQSRSALESAIEQVRRYDEGLLAAAGKALTSAEFAYQHGAIGVMDLLDARRVYKSTQMDAITARANYAKALASWRFANEAGGSE